MATPATSPIPLMVASSSPMSHFSYRGAGLEMADDEEESTFAPGSSSAPAAPAPAPLLPPRLQKIQESSSTPSFLNPQNVSLNASMSCPPSQGEQRRHQSQHTSRFTEVFSTIETIPHCDDDDNYRQGSTEGHRKIDTGDEKKHQSADESIYPGSHLDSMVKADFHHDWPANNIGESSGIGVLGIGSIDRRTGGPSQPLRPAESNNDHRTISSDFFQKQGQGEISKTLNQSRLSRNPIALDGDDNDDDDDDDDVSKSDGTGKKRHTEHEVDYDDDFIKSFFDHAVDAPCQRFTVAPCMADLMDRQLDLFMVRGF